MSFKLFTVVTLLVINLAGSGVRANIDLLGGNLENALPSEFFYQVNQGESYLQVNIDYASSAQQQQQQNFNFGGANFTPNTSLRGINYQLAYEIGLLDMLAAYISIGQGRDVIETEANFNNVNSLQTQTNTFVGLNPIDLGLKFRMGLGPGVAYIQGNLKLGSIENTNYSIDQDGNLNNIFNYQINRMTGRDEVALRLGYAFSYDNYSFGSAIETGIFSENRSQQQQQPLFAGNPNINLLRKSGTVFSLFHERMVRDKHILGVLLTYASGVGLVGPYSRSVWGGVFRDANIVDESSLIEGRLYGRVQITDHFHLLGNLGYSSARFQFGEGNNNNNNQNTVYNNNNNTFRSFTSGLGLRYIFF